MARYMTMLLNRGEAVSSDGPPSAAGVLSPRSFELLITPVQKAPSWGEDAGYAYGFAVDELPVQGSNTPHLRLRHTGGMVAFSSAIHVDMTAGVAGFASTNCNLERYRPNDIVSYALNLVRAVNDKRELPPVPPPDDPARVENANEYAGTYKASDVFPPEYTVVARGTELYIARSQAHSARLLRTGVDRFVPFNPKHPPTSMYSVRFGRQDGKVSELFFADFWGVNERYAGPRQLQYPKEWEAFPGHYRNNDPWLGSVRVFLRKGKLWLNDDELAPLPNGMFRPAEEEYSPERVSFENIVEGKAQRMVFSGVDFERVGD
jgi:hypothetical protein